MPTVDPDLIPTVQPGNLFNTFTTDSTFNIRWIAALEPVYFEIQNRPIADVVVRQLVIAKAIDAMQLRLSHQSLFPFLVVCKITVGSTLLETPPSWIWDMHVSMPSKWENIRLAKIKRISGTNDTSGSSGGSTGGGSPTGKLRLIFSGQQKNSSVEVSLFYIDYIINSLYSYQISRVSVVTSVEESNAIDPSEAETVDGFIIMRTLDMANDTELSFIISLAPPSDQSLNPDGTYVHPAVYEIASTPPGGASETNDFAQDSIPHGTGLLVVSAYNAIPAIDSDIATWLRATNYPFRVGATRTSTNGITIPAAMFNEFSMIVPAPDEATGDVSMNNSPVWLSSIERLDDLANQLLFTFSTYSIEGSTPHAVEVGTLTLDRSYTSGQVVNIVPLYNLLQAPVAANAEFLQGYGSGHVVLGAVWGGSTSEINDFFDLFLSILDVPAKATFNKASAILSSYSLNRVPRTVPTVGQFDAAAGTTGRRVTPIYPSDDNRFVTEQDIGKGDPINFDTLAGFPDALRENTDIESIGYKGGIVHPIVTLIVNAAGTSHDYTKDVLPRLVCLLGRSPQFGDFWWDGTLLKFHNGDTWIAL